MAVWDYPTNVSNFAEMGDYLNYATGNLFGLILILILFIVIFLNMKKYPTEQAFAASMFICTVIAIFLRALGLVGDLVMFGCIILSGVSAVYIMLRKKD